MNILSAQLITYLQQELNRLYEQKATGELILSHGNISTTIFLLAGRLQYITDGMYRVRRWQRCISVHCPDWTPPTTIVNSQLWEYDFLYQGLSQKEITLNQAKSVIKAVAEECLSELALVPQIKAEWVDHDRVKSTFSYFLSLSLPEIHPVLTEIDKLHQQWHKNGLDKLRPSLAPNLLEKGKITINNVAQQKYLNGKFTIWDIALKLKQPMPKVAHSLITWQEKGLIEFKKIDDLPTPVQVVQQKKESHTTQKLPAVNSIEIESNLDTFDESNNSEKPYLIACIDDSAIVIHNLRTILVPAGFQVLSINEPMAGFGKLIEHKPDLILLDLNMPNANGYSICKFLRETPVFVDTPIIILTAQDSSIDRTRAKLVGANDFINKPPEAQALVALIHRYLKLSKKNLKNLATA
ncbi:PleD family two-component system response regulator [Geminocystis sp. NIES-3709]|uniref:response regulator n=1 Tax=Geminocystis sp. NIES-3709 TaxID=1617448 RepID=UPI0005FCB336|nr:response regulator [Geminocystis sp. NIES-3709]BAQ66038.1 PatA subfamily protein [Geminocystis sp. NIES-3709]